MKILWVYFTCGKTEMTMKDMNPEDWDGFVFFTDKTEVTEEVEARFLALSEKDPVRYRFPIIFFIGFGVVEPGTNYFSIEEFGPSYARRLPVSG